MNEKIKDKFKIYLNGKIKDDYNVDNITDTLISILDGADVPLNNDDDKYCNECLHCQQFQPTNEYYCTIYQEKISISKKANHCKDYISLKMKFKKHITLK